MPLPGNQFVSFVPVESMHALPILYIYIYHIHSENDLKASCWTFFLFLFWVGAAILHGRTKIIIIIYIYIWWQRTRIIMLNFFLFVFYRSALYCMGERKSYMCNSGPKGSTMKQQTHVDTTKFTDTSSRIRFESDFNQSSVQNWIMTNYYH